MNAQYHKLKGFSLVELLVVIAIITSLLAILCPSLSRARLLAKILVVNQELDQIGLALETYEFSNNSWPPVRWDCMKQGNFYSLPHELVKGGYIPKGGQTSRKKDPILFSNIEDKFYPGHTYKYMAPGPQYDYASPYTYNFTLYISTSFPAKNSNDSLIGYSDRKKSPVKWVLFSLGPGYNITDADSGNFPLNKGFPVSQDFWYSQKAKSGVLTRIKMRNGEHVGTFRIGR